jgi:hypothetical protein
MNDARSGQGVKMKMKHYLSVVAPTLIVLGSAAFGAGMERPSLSEAPLSAQAQSSPAQEDKGKSTPPAEDAPLTREQVLKEGPTALEQNCNKCHGSDKWEGTSRDHDGWAAIVKEMSRQMDEAKMKPMSNRTTNLIVDYLTLTHPQ